MLIKMIKIFSKKPLISSMIRGYCSSVQTLEEIGMPLLVLYMRYWIAKIFWASGLVKISSWQSTLFLFKEEYKVPIIPYELAAYLATFFELTCPVLLLLGLATRLATLPLLTMTAVIQFTYLDLVNHYYWAMLLGLILCYGPGPISFDYLISKKWGKKNTGK